jgi:very-short-patch-repair endonuclease
MRRKSATKIEPAFWRAVSLPVPESEYRFHPIRKWRFDYAWPEKHIAVEIEGGLYVNGGHVRGFGYEKNLEKYNAAVLHGWSILRYPPNKIDFQQIRTLYNGA